MPLFLAFTIKADQFKYNNVSVGQMKDRKLIKLWKYLFMRIWINTACVLGFAASQLGAENDLLDAVKGQKKKKKNVGLICNLYLHPVQRK